MKLLQLIWNGLTFLFPFFKELLFGDPDASQDAYHRNKMVVFLIGCLLVMFMFYYHTTYKFDRVMAANADLSEKNAVLRTAYADTLRDDQQARSELVQARLDAVCPPTQTASALNKRIVELRVENDKLSSKADDLQKQIDNTPIVVCPVSKPKPKHK